MSNQMTTYQEYIHMSRYARWIDDKGRRETWEETVDRYCDFFINRVKGKSAITAAKIDTELRNAIKDMQVMPSMRCMMSAGPALEKSNVAGYNCSAIAIDHIRSFDEILYILMCGTGVGFSVERQFIVKLPEVAEDFHKTDTVIQVPDSKIGWAKSFKELISLLYNGQIPKWDMSKVRAEGEVLKTFGGRASGPAPLNDLFDFSVALFLSAKGRKLTSVECHDLVCKVAEIVVVGGVRRSALISLSNLSDDRMRAAKTGQWWIDNPQRALANNSAVYTDKPNFETFMSEWISMYESKAGERGIFSRKASKIQAGKNDRRNSDHEFLTNPCCFVGNMKLLTDEGYKTFGELAMHEAVQIVNCNGDVSEGKVWKVGTKDVVTISFPEILKKRPIICTPDHIFMLSDGRECRADDLKGRTLKSFGRFVWSLPIIVADVQKSKAQRDVYDFTEPRTHWGVVEGVVVHNSEIILRPQQFCNLSEVVVRNGDSLDTLKEKVRQATILGTIQSTLTDFKYIRKIWEKNTEEERLLGVSLTGIYDHNLLGGKTKTLEGKTLPQVLEILKQIAIDTNKECADKLGIPESTAITCVKPSGTVSQLVDSASGIHARFAEYYIRRVRSDKKDPITQFMIDKGFPYEDEVTNESTVVFSFPQSAPAGMTYTSEVSATDQLKLWETYQRYWCEHKPSITVYYSDDEFLGVGQWVWDNLDDISGISFLPRADHVYRQPPYEEIDKAEFMKLQSEMPVLGGWGMLSTYESSDMTTASQELSCSSAEGCDVI